MERLIIRADANPQIGVGHLMRCKALGESWETGKVTLITSCTNDKLLQKIRDEGFDIVSVTNHYPSPIDWKVTSDILSSYPEAWVVLDGYHFDSSYQYSIKQTHKLIVIDDNAHLNHYYSDIILNQNIHSKNTEYHCESYTKLLLGTEYNLLRKEFSTRKHKNISEVGRHILVTLGGADYENYTLKVINAIRSINIPDVAVIIVVGAENQNSRILEQAIKESNIPMWIIKDSNKMVELMEWADISISGGGTTVWELAFMGVPNLILVLAENQYYVAEESQRYGSGISLGWASRIMEYQIAGMLVDSMYDPTKRRGMSKRGQQLIDGKGSERVVREMNR